MIVAIEVSPICFSIKLLLVEETLVWCIVVKTKSQSLGQMQSSDEMSI